MGLLEVLPQQLQWRPPAYVGRSDLETLLGSEHPADWVGGGLGGRHRAAAAAWTQPSTGCGRAGERGNEATKLMHCAIPPPSL